MADYIWRLIFERQAEKKFKKLDTSIQKRIISVFREKVLQNDDPKQFADQLVGDLKGLYRYRIGDYRLICVFEEDELIITAVEVGHRRETYLNIKRRPII